MKAVVVYESIFGNTAAVARAVAAGLGPESRAVTTDEATPDVMATADLVVVGAPVIAFNLASDKARESIARSEHDGPTPPDTAHPSIRTWLAGVPEGCGIAATFETRLWWSLRGATGSIESGLRKAGYRTIGKAEKFIVEGKYGPLREGELDRAKAWGETLAKAITAAAPA